MASIHVRTDQKTKVKAQRVLERLGLDLTTAINVYLVQIIERQAVPFEIRTANGFTPAEEKAIIREAEEAKKSGKRYATIEEAHADILGE